MARRTVVALAIVFASATVPSQVRDPAVGALTGEMVVQAPDGRKIGRLEAKVTYFLSAQAGEAGIRFTPSDRATTVSASAEFTAARQEEALGAVTALMLALAGRQGSDRTSLRLSNVRVEGDPDAVRGHVDGIIVWWDEQAGMAVPNYLSPSPGFAHVGRLVLNVWGTESTTSRAVHGYAILVFDPANPGSVSSGRIVRHVQGGSASVIDLPAFGTFGGLTPMTNTPVPNDYLLGIATPPSGEDVHAELVIVPLPDGSFDVRGVARTWLHISGAFTVEGIGTAKFTPPGS
jgi:hypothetical protein